MHIVNRKAYHEYNILETLEAGVVLTGPEVKSIRAGRVDIGESFARVQNGEVMLKNAYIYPYLGQVRDYDPRHDRKLLLHKKQISSLQGKLSGGGLTLVPLKLYAKNNYIKVELGLAATKRKFDKKRVAKERDEQLRLNQELKEIY